HPPDAGPQTIRGRFWCDNAVANLLHTSDDYSEAERELHAVNLGALLAREFTPLPLSATRPLSTNYVAHCGISVVCDLVNRLLNNLPGVEALVAKLPPSGDARET